MLHVRFHQCPLAPTGERRSAHGSRSRGFEVSETVRRFLGIFVGSPGEGLKSNMAKEKVKEDEAGNCYLWSFAIPRVSFLGPLTLDQGSLLACAQIYGRNEARPGSHDFMGISWRFIAIGVIMGASDPT